MTGLVQDHREVCRTFGLVEIVGQLPQHGCVAINGADRRALWIGEWRQAVIGPENIGGSIDEIEVLLFIHHGGTSSESRSWGAPTG